MVPLIAPVIAELGIELVPLILYGGYKTAEFANKGGFKAVKQVIGMATTTKKAPNNNRYSKVKK